MVDLELVVQKLLTEITLKQAELRGMATGVKEVYERIRAEHNKSSGDTQETQRSDNSTVPE